MKSHRNLVIVVFAIMSLTVIGSGCARKAAAPPPIEGIKYEMGEGAELSKVTWYLKEGLLMVDVEVKNTSATERKFEVGVKVDDGVFVIAGLEADKAVKPGAKMTYSTQPGFATATPAKLTIRVTPA